MIHLRRSLFITFFSTNAMTVVQFGVTLVLARLLTPAEVGIFSITSVVIGLAAVFRDFGVSSYLQRERDLTPQKIASALGLLLTTSWLLAAGIYLASDSVAAYYGQPGIARVMRVLTLSFCLLPFASFFYSLLSRDLNAGKQAIVNAAGTLVYALTCITLAYRGHSYMALAWANVANIGATIVVYLLLRPAGLRLLPSLRGWGRPVRYGTGAILSNLINYVHGAIPDLVLGKLSGPYSVGLYSRANGLVGIFQQIAGPTINYNALPYIAAHHHANEPLAPILCASYAIRIGFSLCPAALMAIGRPYLSALTSGAAVLTRIVLIALFGAHDVLTFAWALVVADLIAIPVPALLMATYLRYSVRLSAAAQLPSIVLGLVCAAVALGLRASLPEQWPDLARLAIVGLVLAPTWLAAVLLLKHPLRAELPALPARRQPRGVALK